MTRSIFRGLIFELAALTLIIPLAVMRYCSSKLFAYLEKNNSFIFNFVSYLGYRMKKELNYQSAEASFQ